MFPFGIFGWCVWDLPALIVLMTVIMISIVCHAKLNKIEKDLMDELADRMACVSIEKRM